MSSPIPTEFENIETNQESISPDSIPEYDGKPYVEVNNNKPYFNDEYFTLNPFETYSPLDELGWCGVAFANIGADIMPTDERGNIGMIKPSGWHTIRYDNVDG